MAKYIAIKEKSKALLRRTLFIVLFTFFTYVPSVFWCKDYLFDDANAIKTNSDVIQPHRSLIDIFRHDFWGTHLNDAASHKSYRPLTILVYRLLYSWGSSISVFRTLNIGLHVLNTYLVSKLARLLNLKGWFVASLIFGIHPVHSEPVLALVGASDLFYSQIVLIALILTMKTKDTIIYGTSAILSLLSVMYKEQGVMLLPMVLTLDAFVKKNNAKAIFWKAAFSILICCGITSWRLFIMDFKTPTFQEGDNPASFLPTLLLRFINYNYIYVINLWMLIVPIWQCFDWSMGCIPTIQEPNNDIRILAVIFLWCFALFVFKQVVIQRKNILLFILLGLIPFIPAMNIFFRVGFVIAERNLYLSLMGYSFLIGEGLEALRSKFKNTLNTFVFLTIGVFALTCIKRSNDWSSESRLFNSGLRVCPLNAKIYYNIAKRESEGSRPQLDKVISFYETSLHLWPNYEHAMNNLGNVYRSIKEYDRARRLYEDALSLSPTFASCWMNLGILHTAQENYVKAEKCYLEAIKWRRGYSDCYYNLGILYIKMRRLSEAKISFLKSINLNPNSIKSWINLVILLDELKSHSEAKDFCLKALKVFPNAPDLMFHLANSYGKMENWALAEEFYLKAISSSSKNVNPSYHLNLGILYHRSQQIELAYNRYKMVLSMDPSNVNAKKYIFQLEQKYKFIGS